jgi:deoxyadenosine/deoxycytidine kinase
MGALAHADAPSANRSAIDVRVTSAMISSGRLQFRYIAVEGPIGAGKTTLAERLGIRFDATLVLEDTDNPFLADFYADRPGAALQAQLFYLINRHRQQTALRQADLFSQLMIADYLFDKDKIFAYLNLDDNELFIYQRIYDLLARDVPPPDLVVYLQSPTDVLLRRIRGRRADPDASTFEPDPEYVRELNEAYHHFFFHYDATPLLVVETSQFDSEVSDEALDDLVKQIRQMGPGTRYYVPRTK